MKYTYDIASEYRTELQQLRRQHMATKREIAWLRELDEYGERLSELEADLKVISGMISSTEYALFWIESGHERMQGEKRPITNLSKKKRTQLWGNIEHSNYLSLEEPRELSSEELALIDHVMGALSQEERDAYMSIYGKGNSYAETAEYLGVARSTVQRYIERAKKKIDHQLLYGTQMQLV